MTEGGQTEHIDLFLRQALLGSNRVPVLWGGTWDLLKMLHEEADVDVGEWGLATDGIVALESEEQAKNSPYASYGMKCKEAVQHLCNAEPRFCAKCWIDRDDGIKPEANQRPSPRGQVKWHPGWRSHQLTGRNLAFAVLQALQVAINQWSDGVMGTCSSHLICMEINQQAAISCVFLHVSRWASFGRRAVACDGVLRKYS
jgi:hypothetical protein